MQSQDIIGDIGSPSNIYYKNEDKMSIHSSNKDKEEVTQSNNILYNSNTLK